MTRWITVSVGFCLLTAFVLPLLSTAAPQNLPKSRIAELWDGKLSLALPLLAQDPVKVDADGKLFSVRPPEDRTDLKYIVYVAREPLRADEESLSGNELNESVKKMLVGLGYEIISSTYSDLLDTFLVDFRAVMEPGTLPWQQVGPGIVRGKAKFFRVGDELMGSVLLCDPSQWKDGTTQSFIRIIGGTTVSR